MKRIGYLYLHAPDPKIPGQYVTHRIAVEQIDDLTDDGESYEEEAGDETA